MQRHPSHFQRDPRASRSRVTCAISLSLFRSNSISNLVSIRGVGEEPSLRFSSAVEGVTKPLELPSFNGSDMSFFLLVGISMKFVSAVYKTDFENDKGRNEAVLPSLMYPD